MEKREEDVRGRSDGGNSSSEHDGGTCNLTNLEAVRSMLAKYEQDSSAHPESGRFRPSEWCLTRLHRALDALEREPVLMGLLRLVADNCQCERQADGREACVGFWPNDMGEWCPPCLVRAALEVDVELPEDVPGEPAT